MVISFRNFSSRGPGFYDLSVCKKSPAAPTSLFFWRSGGGGQCGREFLYDESPNRIARASCFPVIQAGPIIAAVILSLAYFKEKIKPGAYFGIMLGLAGIVLLTLK